MPRRRLSGQVVSDKMEKTVVVQVDDQQSVIPCTTRFMRTAKKYLAHDEESAGTRG